MKLAGDYDLKAPHYLILLIFFFLLVPWSLHSIPLSSSQRPKSKSKCFSMTLTITGCPGNASVPPRKTEVAATMHDLDATHNFVNKMISFARSEITALLTSRWTKLIVFVYKILGFQCCGGRQSSDLFFQRTEGWFLKQSLDRIYQAVLLAIFNLPTFLSKHSLLLKPFVYFK